MARILGGGLFGEMRGKLGSLVFARNRGGAYSRAYAKPVDPRTIAQLSARNNFGSASSNYHSLDPATKTLWQNFANSVFNPKTGTMGVPSGFNAFVSLLNVVNNVKPMTVTVEFDGTPKPTTEIPYLFEGIPPTNALESNFLNATGGSIPYNFGGISNFGISYAGDTADVEVDFKLNISGGIGTSGLISNFRDAKANKFGFAVYMSNPVQQPGMFVNNPYNIKLGDVLPQVLTTASAPNEEIKIKTEISLLTSKYSAWPADDQWVELTIFAQSETGMLLRIGSEFQQL